MKHQTNGVGPAPPKTIRHEVIFVTPKMAKEWLEKHNTANIRPVNWGKVETLATDIKAGNFELTHQGILFGRDDLLCDGQHRLHAVVHSEMAVWMMVTWDPTATPKGPYDTGTPRSIATILQKRGKEVASLNLLRSFEQGYELRFKMSVAEAEAVAARHGGELEKILAVDGAARLHGPVLAACAWAYPCSAHKVCEFAEKIATGEMIGRGNPAYQFRNWLERNKAKGHSWEKGMACLNAIRYFVHDATMSSVFTGEMGYRAVTARRRALKVPHTPGTDLVVGTSWTPKDRENDTGA